MADRHLLSHVEKKLNAPAHIWRYGQAIYKGLFDACSGFILSLACKYSNPLTRADVGENLRPEPQIGWIVKACDAHVEILRGRKLRKSVRAIGYVESEQYTF